MDAKTTDELQTREMEIRTRCGELTLENSLPSREFFARLREREALDVEFKAIRAELRKRGH